MCYIEKQDQSGEKVKLYYEEYGAGKPVVLIHGWPLSLDMWEYQVTELGTKGFKFIAYDRRGFGKSSRPWNGYDYDTLASDLNDVMEKFDLKDVTLVGFSMGGGEVVRYISKYGSSRVSKIVLISAVTPFMMKNEGNGSDNPEGVDAQVFKDIELKLKEDRAAFLEGFAKDFYGVSLVKHPVSDAFLTYNLTLTSLASGRATQQCAKAFAETDFRKDIETIKVPTLIIHGDADKTVPIDASGKRTAKLIPGSQFIIYEGAPHGLWMTHKERLNKDLLNFLQS